MTQIWTDREYAERYNRIYATSPEEFRACLDLLDLGPSDSLVDFGCGNGDFLALACELVRSATGVDLSRPQIEEARAKLQGRAEIVQSTFLDFDAGPRRFTRGFSRKALHHLTDPEKDLFLQRVGPAFLPGALFLLEDGMFFGFERADLEAHWDGLMREAEAYYGEGWAARKADLVHSMREEFPPGAAEWERLFEKAGFRVVRRLPRCSFYGALLAIKTEAAPDAH